MRLRCSQGPRAIARILTLWSVLALAASCATTGGVTHFSRATLQGVVVDEDGVPVPCASVSADGNTEVRTSRDGRFMLPDVPHGSVRLVVTKDGYASVTGEVMFTDRTRLFCLRISSAAHIREQAVNEAVAGRMEAALALADEAVALAADDLESQFVVALLCHLSGRPNRARSILGDFPELSGLDAVDQLRIEMADCEGESR